MGENNFDGRGLAAGTQRLAGIVRLPRKTKTTKTR